MNPIRVPINLNPVERPLHPYTAAPTCQSSNLSPSNLGLPEAQLSVVSPGSSIP